jgi:hypothetical protein
MCKKGNPDCIDKNSIHYFMHHMTQEEWENRMNLGQFKKDRELLYNFNKILEGKNKEV